MINTLTVKFKNRDKAIDYPKTKTKAAKYFLDCCNLSHIEKIVYYNNEGNKVKLI